MNFFSRVLVLGCLSFFSIAHSGGSSAQLPIKKVVLWGHKIHSSTHSYIHYGFERAFRHLGYETLWLDNGDNVSTIDFTGALFITEGQVDQNIPLRSDCFYILHNCDVKKYQELWNKNRCIILQVYSHDCIQRNDEKIGICMHRDKKNKTLYIPWATDLLPHEIDAIKEQLATKKQVSVGKEVNFVGTVWGGEFGNIDQIEAFKRACHANHIKFNAVGGWDCEKHIEYIQQAYMAPALQGSWQVKKGYIPCRILKNISYGQMGITNSKAVYDLFEGKIVYNEDAYQLFYDAQKRLQTLTLSELHELMDFVRNKHTYINRIGALLDFFVLVNG